MSQEDRVTDFCKCCLGYQIIHAALYQINASCDQFKFLSSSVLCFEVTEHPNDKSNNYVAVLTYLGKM